MKTKIRILFILFSSLSFSQSLEKLKLETTKIYDAHYAMDFEAIVNLTYPKIVDSNVARNAALDELDLDYQNGEYRMRLELVNPIFQYSEIKKIEGKTFCIITYKNPTRYFFENKLNAKSVTEYVAWLKESNKTNDVIYEPKRNSINVKRISKLIAIWDETTQNEWKFFNFDNSTQSELFGIIFNENIKKELGF